MKDPTRWCDDEDVSELERALLRAGQEDRLPASERRALWAGIVRTLPSAAARPKSGRFSGKWLKGALLVAALGGISLAAQQAVRGSAPRPSSPDSASMKRPPVASVATSAVVRPEPSAAEPLGAEPSEARSPAVSESRRSAGSQLLEESHALLDARAALRAGDATHALTLLERARSRFPRGSLGQEREALTVEALARSGQSTKARLRAEKFLRAYPQSPYAADVRRASGP